MNIAPLIKLAVANLFRRLGLWRYLGLPKEEMSVSDYTQQNYATYSPQLALVYSSSVQRDLPPGTIEGSFISWKFKNLYSRTIPDAFVLRLPAGRVIGTKGAVITPEGFLLRDVSREFGNRRMHSAFRKLSIGKTRKLQRNVAVLVTDGGSTFYHWMFDILPRLHLLEEAGVLQDIDVFILPKLNFPFQTESLQLLNIDKSKIIEASSEDFNIQAENLFVPSLPSLLGTVNKWANTYLQNKLTFLNLPETTVGKRIYVSRNKANNRRLLNESDLTEMLQKAGFSIIQAEDYSFQEQIAIFQKAEVVVAPHGSGLSNIAFCKPGTTVVDLFSSNFVVPCFWTIANNCGLNYYFLYDGEKDNFPYSPYWEGKATDIVFPKEKLQRLLSNLGLLN